jgi:hypothetical protein
MKKVIRNGVLMLSMLTTLASYANKVSYTSTTTGNKKTVLVLENVKKGHQLKIIDANGIILFKEQINKSGNYVKNFDLTVLPDGNYFFELDKDCEIRVTPFKVVNNTVTFNKTNEQTVFKPIVHKRRNTVYVSRFSFTKNPLSFKIYYENNPEYIIQEKFNNDKTIEKIYDFSKARKGNYKIVFRTEGRVFVEYINI